jgi:hypothetical protein
LGSGVIVIYNVSDILAMKPSLPSLPSIPSATTKEHSSTRQHRNGDSDDNDNDNDSNGDGHDTDDESTTCTSITAASPSSSSTSLSVSKQPKAVRVIPKNWKTFAAACAANKEENNEGRSVIGSTKLYEWKNKNQPIGIVSMIPQYNYNGHDAIVEWVTVTLMDNNSINSHCIIISSLGFSCSFTHLTHPNMSYWVGPATAIVQQSFCLLFSYVFCSHDSTCVLI